MEDTRTFGSFVVNSANRIAVDAARRVAELPGSAPNPLVIVGEAGAGKTHLLHAIAAAASELRPGDDALLTTAVGFATPDARARLLLIDDVYQLPGVESCRVFGDGCLAAISEGAQIVLALRGSAEDLDPAGNLHYLVGLGLTVELNAPDAESRAGGGADGGRVAGADERGNTAELDSSHRADFHERTRLDPSAHPDASASASRTASPPLEHAGGSDAPPSPSSVSTSLPAAAGGDEFGSFLADVSQVVAVAVENVNWRRKLAEAIAGWEGKGIRTDRLEAALEGHAPSDVDALLAAFARDAARLLEIRDAMGADAASTPLDNPDQVAAAESRFASWQRQTRSPSAPAEIFRTVDPWFLDPDRLVLSAFDPEGRVPGDRR